MRIAIEDAEHVARIAGLRVGELHIDGLVRWTQERLQQLRLPGMEPYIELLGQNTPFGRQERERLLVQFTTGETYFFRDLGQIDLLSSTILPELIARRAEARTLRLWSAGCAAGEEAYSLAMLVDELAPSLTGWNVQILGTDINTQALERARRGEYRDWSFRTLDDARKQRYFRRHGDHWLVDQRLRDRVTFRSVDLVRDPFPDAATDLAEFDLILCRNVFIYLDSDATDRITSKFARALADGGHLMAGHNELFGHDTTPLRVRLYPQSAVYQRTTQPPVEVSPGAALAQVQAPTIATGRHAISIDRKPTLNEARAFSPPPPLKPRQDCAALMKQAWRHADGGMREAAEHDCHQVIAIADLDHHPYFLLAQLAQERGDVAQAKALLSKVLYLDPSFIAAYLELGGLHAQTGDDDRARRMYETVRSALAKLPPQTVIAPYDKSTAGEILGYIERLLAEPRPVPPPVATAISRAQPGA